MLRLFFTLSAFLFSCTLHGQSSGRIIKVHFLYGSRPAKGFKDRESKRFGGIMGGHVSLEIDGHIFGFTPEGSFHVFPKRKNRHSFFHNVPLGNWTKDTVRNQYLSIIIPVTDKQHNELLEMKESILLTTMPFSGTAVQPLHRKF